MIHWTTVLLQWVSPFKVSLQRCLFCMVKVSFLDSIYVSVQCSPSPVLATPCSVWQMGAVTLQLCRGLLWLDSLYWNYFIGFFIGYFQQPRCLSELQADTRSFSLLTLKEETHISNSRKIWFHLLTETNAAVMGFQSFHGHILSDWIK